jgi:hypothetical protein
MPGTEVIVFPDATELFADHLRVELDERGYTDLHVGTRIPNPRPDRFVRVLRTGGTRRNLVVDESQLTIEAWAESEQVAQDMAQLARAIVGAARGDVLDGVPIYRVDDVTGPGALPSGPVYTPDPISQQPRFSFSMLVACRGAVV